MTRGPGRTRRLITCLPKGERERCRTLIETLVPWRNLFTDCNVLDYGASVGTSTIALLHHGSRDVVGVDIDTERIERGRTILATTPYRSSVRLLTVPDTRTLPFGDGAFRFALANAVIEHIPQPRDAHLRELWRVVAPGGHLMISETPNKYFPRDIHTTGLWFNQWLPKPLAYRRALRRQRFAPQRTDWDRSGWRGAGYYEIAPQFAGAVLIPEHGRLRHRLLARLGIPASILDPYPIWVFHKLRYPV